MQKTISFAVCCYNSEDYMETCLRSLLQGGETVEIIVVDDGSKDSTGKIADSYQAKYPSIIKVIHQPNGGHGEGLNQALKIATGLYFKAVDSDDWVRTETLLYLIGQIQQGTDLPDLYVTGYDYHYGHGNIVKRIRYGNALPPEKTVTWAEVRKFRVSEYLTLHSCMYKTKVLRSTGVVLPKHTFYEDNYLIYKGMPAAKTLRYVDLPFYCYLVGRVGQSVSKDVGIRRYKDHLAIARLVLEEYDIYKFKKEVKPLYKTLYHHARLIFALGILHTRMNNSKEAKEDLKALYKETKEKNPRLMRKLEYFSPCAFIYWRGPVGLMNVHAMYWIAHKIVKFN